jgi:invasion protein IalB
MSPFRLGAIAIGAVLIASGAGAAGQNGKKFDDWTIECRPSSPTSKVEVCAASQVLNLKDQKGRLLDFSVGFLDPKNPPTVIATFPLGISLESGVAFMVDDLPQVNLTLKSCIANGCVGVAQLTDAQFKSLLSAKSLVAGLVVTQDDKPQTVKIPLSVKGLKAALESLKK